MLDVPDDVWDKENTQNDSIPTTRQTYDPPPRACISIKIIYNDGWVRSAANGYPEEARQAALDVVAEVQHIYNKKYLPENRLGTALTFNIIGGTLIS